MQMPVCSKSDQYACPNLELNVVQTSFKKVLLHELSVLASMLHHPLGFYLDVP